MNNLAGLVVNGTSKRKDFKPESERKRIDLPAQKNLLTNYFCIHHSIGSNFGDLQMLVKFFNTLLSNY